MRPALKGLPGELGPVVRADESRAFAPDPEVLQHPDHAFTRQRVIRFEPGTAPIPQVPNRQHPDPPPVLQAIAHEGKGPLPVRTRRPGQDRTKTAPALASPPGPQRQPFLTMDALHPLVVHRKAFPPQQDVQPGAAELPAARNSRAPPWCAARPDGVRRAPSVFSQHLPEYLDIQRPITHQPPRAPVPLLQRKTSRPISRATGKGPARSPRHPTPSESRCSVPR